MCMVSGPVEGVESACTGDALTGGLYTVERRAADCQVVSLVGVHLTLDRC